MAVMQQRRTPTPNQAPANGSLEPGVLCVEMASASPRLWVGVDTAIDATGRRLIVDSGAYLPLSGGALTGPLTLAGDATAALQGVTLQQMEAAIQGTPIYTGDNPPPTPQPGDLWFDTINHVLKVWDGSNWVASAAPVTGFLPLTGGTVTGNAFFTGARTAIMNLDLGVSQMNRVGFWDGNSGNLATTGALSVEASNPQSPGLGYGLNVTLWVQRNVVSMAGPSSPTFSIVNRTAGFPYGMWNTANTFHFGIVDSINFGPSTSFMHFNSTGRALFAGNLSVVHDNSPAIALFNTSGGNAFGIWNTTGTFQFGIVDSNTGGAGPGATQWLRFDANGTLNLGLGGNQCHFLGNVYSAVGRTAIMQLDFGTSQATRTGFADGSSGNLSMNGTISAPQMNAVNNTTARGDFGIVSVANSFLAQANIGGDLVGTWSGVSDARLKDDIGELPDVLGCITQLKPRRFKWRKPIGDRRVHLGFVAQDVREVVPEAWAPDKGQGEGIFWMALIAALWRGEQQLLERLNALETILKNGVENGRNRRSR